MRIELVVAIGVTDLGIRRLAVDARKTIYENLQSNELECIELDFKGIESVNQSFLDELIGPIILQIGRDAFIKRVSFHNIDKSVQCILNFVLNLRGKMYNERTERKDK